MPANAPNRSIIITSPHHGSRVNDHAYSVIKKWIPTASSQPFYIRNGGQSGQKLDEYLNFSNRKCAQCVQCFGKNWQQLVELNNIGNNWNWALTTGKKCGTP